MGKDDRKQPLLSSFKLGPFNLDHRVIHAPLTRCRAYNNIPPPQTALYHSQRTTRGGLLIAEATAVSPTAFGIRHTPGIWSEEQIKAWKPIVDAVHEKGGVFFLQLIHVGRVSHTSYQPNGEAPISSSNKPVQGECGLESGASAPYSTPRALETHEIPDIIRDFQVAARNALKAGFDGVEIHAAHGFLVDQFSKESSNDRVDIYGGTLENRCRFLLETVRAISDEIGSQRLGVRISPYSDFMDASDTNPLQLGLYIAEQLNRYSICYLHCVEPRMNGVTSVDTVASLWPIRKAFQGVFMVAGGYGGQDGNEAIESGKADLVAYGRLFLSNPDLPKRFQLNAPLNKYKRETFYTQDPVVGYTDYPFLSSQ